MADDTLLCKKFNSWRQWFLDTMKEILPDKGNREERIFKNTGLGRSLEYLWKYTRWGGSRLYYSPALVQVATRTYDDLGRSFGIVNRRIRKAPGENLEEICQGELCAFKKFRRKWVKNMGHENDNIQWRTADAKPKLGQRWQTHF